MISSAEITSETTTSEEWSFYLEGEASEEGLPFPAQLLAPENNATVNAGSVTLSWNGGHPEGATLRYQVYLGNSATNLSAVGEPQTQSTYILEAAAQQSYFWKIQSLQANGDSSDSVILNFKPGRLSTVKCIVFAIPKSKTKYSSSALRGVGVDPPLLSSIHPKQNLPDCLCLPLDQCQSAGDCSAGCWLIFNIL